MINPLPVVDLGSDITQCGGSVILDAGNPGFDHLWYNSTTNQTLAVYASNTVSVKVTDPVTGCFKSDTINIMINQFPVINLGNVISQCGGTVMLNAGNSGSSFMWSTSESTQIINVANSGTYYVSVTNTGCTAFDTVEVTLNPLPVISFPAIAPLCKQGAAIILSATPVGGIFSADSAVASGMFDPAAAGVGAHPVTYVYTDANSCSNSFTQTINVEDCSGIEELNGYDEINLYPNPTEGMFIISIVNPNFKELNINIVDIQGKEVYNYTDKNISSDYNKQIDLEGSAKGIYFLRLTTENEFKIRKLIIH
jgi:hypothetical protein